MAFKLGMMEDLWKLCMAYILYNSKYTHARLELWPWCKVTVGLQRGKNQSLQSEKNNQHWCYNFSTTVGHFCMALLWKHLHSLTLLFSFVYFHKNWWEFWSRIPVQWGWDCRVWREVKNSSGLEMTRLKPSYSYIRLMTIGQPSSIWLLKLKVVIF